MKVFKVNSPNFVCLEEDSLIGQCNFNNTITDIPPTIEKDFFINADTRWEAVDKFFDERLVERKNRGLIKIDCKEINSKYWMIHNS